MTFCIPVIQPAMQVEVQYRGHMKPIENTRLETTPGAETSGSADISGTETKGTYCYSEMNLCFLIFSCLIFESNVDRGIPSFAAAPCGPATFPLHSANAVSISSRS